MSWPSPILTDEELRTKVHELRSQLEAVKAECDKRHWAAEAAVAATAMCACEDLAGLLAAQAQPLAPWEFVKPNGKVSTCSWCEQEQGHLPDPSNPTSHGMCPRHQAAWRAELQQRRAAA